MQATDMTECRVKAVAVEILIRELIANDPVITPTGNFLYRSPRAERKPLDEAIAAWREWSEYQASLFLGVSNDNQCRLGQDIVDKPAVGHCGCIDSIEDIYKTCVKCKHLHRSSSFCGDCDKNLSKFELYKKPVIEEHHVQ